MSTFEELEELEELNYIQVDDDNNDDETELQIVNDVINSSNINQHVLPQMQSIKSTQSIQSTQSTQSNQSTKNNIDPLEIYAQIMCDFLKNTKLKNTKVSLNKGNRGKRTSGMNLQSDKKANKQMEEVAYKKIPHQFNIVGGEQLDVVLKKAMYFKFKNTDTGDLATQLEKVKKARLYSQEMISKEISLITRKLKDEDKRKVRFIMGDLVGLNQQKLTQLEEFLNTFESLSFEENLDRIKNYYQEILDFDSKSSNISKEMESRHTDRYNKVAVTCFNILAGTHRKYNGATVQKFYEMIAQKYKSGNSLPVLSENIQKKSVDLTQSHQSTESTYKNKSDKFEKTQKYERGDSQFKNNSDKFSNKFSQSSNNFNNSNNFSNPNTFNDDGWQTQKSKNKHPNKQSLNHDKNNNYPNDYTNHDNDISNSATNRFGTRHKIEKVNKSENEYPELSVEGKKEESLKSHQNLGAWGKKSSAVYIPPEIKQEKSDFLQLFENDNFSKNTNGIVTLDKNTIKANNKVVNSVQTIQTVQTVEINTLDMTNSSYSITSKTSKILINKKTVENLSDTDSCEKNNWGDLDDF